MNEDRIERDTLIAAPLARVWSLVAEPSTLVDFMLSAEGDKTRLRVVESGFASLSTSAELREQTIRFNTAGWPQMFDAVRTRAEQAR